MKEKDWGEKTDFYELAEDYCLRRADWREYSRYFAVYVVYYQNTWFRHSFNQACSILTDCDCCYWIEKDGKRIGGVLMESNYINCLFLMPPHNELDKVLQYLKALLLCWSDRSKDILAPSIKQDQLRQFQRAGFRERETRRCMIRPTEVFEVKWDARFVLEKPKPENQEELVKLFTEVFRGAAGSEGTMSEEEYRESIKYYLDNFCGDKVLQSASVLVYDRYTGALAGASLISQWEDWPNFYLMGTKREYQGLGLGTCMFKHGLTALHGHYPVARLFVTLGNEAEMLYHKLGFMAGIETAHMYIPALEK